MLFFYTKTEIVKDGVTYDMFKAKYIKTVSFLTSLLLLIYIFSAFKQISLLNSLTWILLFGLIIFHHLEINIFNILQKKNRGKKIIFTYKFLVFIDEIYIER